MTLNITVGGYAELEEFCRQFLAGQASRKPVEDFQERTEEMKEKVRDLTAVKAGEPVNPAPVIPETDHAPTPEPEPPVQPEPPAPKPVAYTREALTRAAMVLVDEGRKEELQALLVKFGVNSMPSLAKENYAAFAEELKALGASL